ncbi:MAG: helicase-related protein [Gemmatimonadaceae bacterium]
MDRLATQHPDAVRASIATEWLRAGAVNPKLGAVTLRPHQMDAANRLRAMLVRSGGALLCDDVGLGKTYVALAIARHHQCTLVIAPASLREMWRSASRSAAVSIAFTSMESLSRGSQSVGAHDLVVVDEAHHFRTPSTARFRSLGSMTARSRVLLLTATPLHNRREDVTTLLSLFLGSATATMSDAATARHIVRRYGSDAPGDLPEIVKPVRIAVSDNAPVLQALIALPPPTPPGDGGLAAAMVLHTLVRTWTSSDAALRESLRRRLARTIAIRESLEKGTHPTRRELQAWTYGDGAVQLGFASILASEPAGDPSALLEPAVRHEKALVDILEFCPRISLVDAERVEHVRLIRRRHAGAKIVAFSQFAETVRMYYSALVRDGRVAMLTSRGARIASGPITRSDALRRFAPNALRAAAPMAAEEISLLVTTDLLSEGVNLQDACVVIHLDLPWTAATLDQRTGRVARLGSLHTQVFVYSLDPPASSEELLKAESIIRRKLDLSVSGIGPSRIPPLFARIEPAPGSQVEDAEAIRRVLQEWSVRFGSTSSDVPLCAFVSADRDGMLALVSVRGRSTLIAGAGRDLTADLHVVREMLGAVGTAPARSDPSRLASGLAAVGRWIERELASGDAGRSDVAPTALAQRVGARFAVDLASCPRHALGDRSSRIAAIHVRMRSHLTLGVEQEVDTLLRADASPHDFLSTLEQILGQTPHQPPASSIELLALLVLRRPH